MSSEELFLPDRTIYSECRSAERHGGKPEGFIEKPSETAGKALFPAVNRTDGNGFDVSLGYAVLADALRISEHRVNAVFYALYPVQDVPFAASEVQHHIPASDLSGKRQNDRISVR